MRYRPAALPGGKLIARNSVSDVRVHTNRTNKFIDRKTLTLLPAAVPEHALALIAWDCSNVSTPEKMKLMEKNATDLTGSHLPGFPDTTTR